MRRKVHKRDRSRATFWAISLMPCIPSAIVLLNKHCHQHLVSLNIAVKDKAETSLSVRIWSYLESADVTGQVVPLGVGRLQLFGMFGLHVLLLGGQVTPESLQLLLCLPQPGLRRLQRPCRHRLGYPAPGMAGGGDAAARARH